MKTFLYAAFCGTGKTYACNQLNTNAIEIEYWKYTDDNKYLLDIKKEIGKVDYIFISTEPKGLKLLYKFGYDITLVYPENELRNEYLDRYINRDSPYDFIGTFMKHWNIWIDELKEQEYCSHLVLKSGEYLHDYLERRPPSMAEDHKTKYNSDYSKCLHNWMSVNSPVHPSWRCTKCGFTK